MVGLSAATRIVRSDYAEELRDSSAALIARLWFCFPVADCHCASVIRSEASMTRSVAKSAKGSDVHHLPRQVSAIALLRAGTLTT